ncbi:MAG: YdgA family protein, partial [Porticoccaceae bacterium]|nr:YdgA family protein [Porticoccaceae bacterium]
MKKLLIVVLLLAVVVAGGPLYTAKLAHDGLQQQMAQMNEMPGYKAELVEYEKGWFNATARMRIGMDADMLAGTPNADKIGDLSMLFDLDIAHGPLLLADGVGVGLVSAKGTLNEDNMPELTEFREQAGLDALLTFQQTTDLLGVSHYSTQVPEFEVSDAGGKLTFGGMKVAGDYDLKDNTMSGKGTIGELTVAGDGAYILVEAMQMDFDIEFLNWMVQLGRQDLLMPGIKVFQGGDASGVPVMSVSNVKLLSDASQDTDNTIAVKMTLAADNMQGQGMDLQNLNFDFVLERISLKAIEQFVELYDGAMQNMADPQLAQIQMASGVTA